MARHTPIMELPAPLVPPVARCRFPELLAEVIPLSRRRHKVILPCFEKATRRVTVGLVVASDVCLWHSLVACNRMGGYLVREPFT